MAAGEQLAQQHTQRPDVGGRGQRLTAHLLGRGPGWREGPLAGACGVLRSAVFTFVQQPCNAEVQQLGLALLVDHHVAGFDVAVHHQLGVGGRHGQHHVDKQPQARIDAQPAFVAPAVDGLTAHHDLDRRSSEAELTRAGNDYHWYSPLLSERLQGRRPNWWCGCAARKT